ncbi:ERF family protein [Sphingomonas segetis]|uniref:ERF family protein n=1 Tax=Sphingomonas segetis TaxID=1104779 RepID=UPI001E44F2F7|nr:ERF family protein [Sphingomonas segetis]
MTAQSKIEAATPHVYQAIAAVQGELATVGIAKTRRNTQGSGYNFRGIDDVYAALSPLLAKHKLVVVPRVLTREVIERQSKNGGALFYVTVHAEFDFVSAIDGTTHTAATFGEAMDSGDKATNKAMSAAYKYAAFMTFAIPTEGDNDADAVTHEVASAPRRTAMITDEQRSLMTALIPAAGKTVQDIVEAYGVSSIAELSEAKAAAAIARLKSLAKEPA